MKLARKITLALVVLAVLVIAALEALEVRREISRAHEDMVHDHVMLGRAASGFVSKVWQLEGEREALSVLDQANRAQEPVRLRWVFWDVGKGPHAPLVPRGELPSLRAGPVSVIRRNPPPGMRVTYVPVEMAGRPAALEVSESLRIQRERVATMIVQIAVAATTVALLFFLGAYMLGRRLVARPVVALASMARRIGAGDLGARASIPGADELAELGGVMNEMADALHAARERLVAETQARLAALESLRHADRLATVGKLASGVAHELGTPLNVVAARAKMIASAEVGGEGAQDSARVIAEQAQAMTRIIRQLLDFARTRTPNRAAHPVAPLVARTVVLLETMAAAKKVALATEGAADLTVNVDAGQIQQVLANLVLNAIQATTQPGEVRILWDVQKATPPPGIDAQPGGYVRIDIVDRGTGISKDVLPRIFEPFFTTKQVGEGTGLGLSVTYGLIRDHGGWISVASEEGLGSTFSVFLPRRVE